MGDVVASSLTLIKHLTLISWKLQLVAKWLEHARENALSAPKNAKNSQNKQRGLIVTPPPLFKVVFVTD